MEEGIQEKHLRDFTDAAHGGVGGYCITLYQTRFYDAMLYYGIRNGTILHDMCGASRYDTIRYDAILCFTILCYAILDCTIYYILRYLP